MTSSVSGCHLSLIQSGARKCFKRRLRSCACGSEGSFEGRSLKRSRGQQVSSTSLFLLSSQGDRFPSFCTNSTWSWFVRFKYESKDGLSFIVGKHFRSLGWWRLCTEFRPVDGISSGQRCISSRERWAVSACGHKTWALLAELQSGSVKLSQSALHWLEFCNLSLEMVGRLNLPNVCEGDPLGMMSCRADRGLDSPDSGLPPSPSPSAWLLPVCAAKAGGVSPVSEDEGRGSLVGNTSWLHVVWTMYEVPLEKCKRLQIAAEHFLF